METTKNILGVFTKLLFLAGVNFINVLQAVVACADPESTTKAVKSAVSFFNFQVHKS
jgi:hypothetical protein